MDKLELQNAIKIELERLSNVARNDGWSVPRDIKNYQVVERKYSFGKRKCIAYNGPDNTYGNLQASRGLSFDSDSLLNVEEYCTKIAQGAIKLRDIDIQRMKLLHCLCEQFSVFSSIDYFVELGFRQISLLKYANDQFGLKPVGYDISLLSVMIAQYLGYDARQYDLNACDGDLCIPAKSLIISYACFEHLSDPLRAIKKVYDSMDKHSFLHIEVPIENSDMPNVRYAHMFAFRKNDLRYMMENAGFEILHSASNCGNDIFLARKND